jgi:GTP-binding protein Era
VLVGRPNAGKSSLLNALLEQKLSIVSAFAQTTRERVVGIDTRGGVQMIFLDTPGLVDPAYLLHRSMLHAALQAIEEADVVVLLLDGSAEPPALDAESLTYLRRRADTLLVAINKIDAAPPARLAEAEAWARAEFGSVPIVHTSATTGEGVEGLRRHIGEMLPESPFLYAADDVSSQPVRFFVAELIRETVFEQFTREVPYSVAVQIEEFRESASPIYIRAVVLVERASQKAILIGHKGEAIRRLGQAARTKIESFVGAHVYLDLWIKVLPRWRKDAEQLRRLGFTLPPTQA